MSSIDGVNGGSRGNPRLMDDIDAYTPDQVAAVWRTVQTAPSDLTVGELRAWVAEAAEDAAPETRNAAPVVSGQR